LMTPKGVINRRINRLISTWQTKSTKCYVERPNSNYFYNKDEY
jgi:hypothetical protein